MELNRKYYETLSLAARRYVRSYGYGDFTIGIESLRSYYTGKTFPDTISNIEKLAKR